MAVGLLYELVRESLACLDVAICHTTVTIKEINRASQTLALRVRTTAGTVHVEIKTKYVGILLFKKYT